MNLPNKLTVSRILLVPVFALFAALAFRTGKELWYFLAGTVFAAASLTDMFDGRIARTRNLVTNFGKFADPLADKILTTGAFLYMLQEGVCSPAALLLILFREFAVSGLRMMAAGGKSGRVIPANIWGKMKTVLQMISIMVFYFGSAVFPFLARLLPSLGLFGLLSAWLRTAVSVLCWVCAGVTIASGVTYFAAARDVLKE